MKSFEDSIQSKLSKDEEAFIIHTLASNAVVSGSFLQSFVFSAAVPSVLIERLVRVFSAGQSQISPQNLVNLFAVFTHKNVEERKFLLKVLAEANYDHAPISKIESFISLCSGNPTSSHAKEVITPESLDSWLEKNSDIPTVNFILHSTITSGFDISRKSGTNVVAASISDVCHLTDAEIEKLGEKFEKYCGYTDHVKTSTISDLLSEYIPTALSRGLASWCDQNRDEKIDFREYCFSISAMTKGPPPERAKHVFHILCHSQKYHNENNPDYLELDDLISLITDRKVPSGALESEQIFMLEAVSGDPDSGVQALLHFYSDILHLALGLYPEEPENAVEIIERFEKSWIEKTLQETRLAWLISKKWYQNWKDEPHKTQNIDNSDLFRSDEPKIFVFENRGEIAVENLADRSIPISRLSFDFLCDLFGPPAVSISRPRVNGKILYDTHSIPLYRHKYAQSSQSTQVSNEKELEIEIDGTIIFWPSDTLDSLKTDLSKVKRQNIENIRLWTVKEKTRELLTNGSKLLTDIIDKDHSILIEFRRHDLSWPEDLAQLARGRSISYSSSSDKNTCTGLINVGNSCYLNAALQALCATQHLVEYFKEAEGLAQWEVNEENTKGYKGHLVVKFNKLIDDLTNKNISCFAPNYLREVLAKKNEDLCRVGQQQDAAEVLAVILDGLHEDLNRAESARYPNREHKYEEFPDSNGRPDLEVSSEHREIHKKFNDSLIVDLFQLQLKSSVWCQKCDFVSNRFDPATFLALPVPTDDSIPMLIFLFQQSKNTLKEYFLNIPKKENFAYVSRQIKYGITRDGISGITEEKYIVFARVNRNQIIQIYSEFDQVPLSASQNPAGDLNNRFIAYLLPKSDQIKADHPKLEPHVIISHRTQNTNFLTNKKRYDFIGQPFLVPRNSDILNDVHESLKPLLKSSIIKNKKDRKSGQAEDCDDLLRERAPYTIHIVLKNDLESCGVCNWNELCHGCDVRNLKNFCNLLPTQTLVVHWEPISLHFHFKEALIERRTNQEPGKDFTVMNCLKLFEVSEEISEWNCPRCKVPCPAKKQLCPFSYPPVLIIHLKRFQINMLNGQWMKCSKKIQVSDQLTFEPLLVEDDRHKIVYKLYAAIIHQGSIHGGHYTALCRRGNSWKLFNDDQITAVSRAEVNSYLSNAYVVFYEASHVTFDDLRPAIDPSHFRDLEEIGDSKRKKDKKDQNCSIS